MAAEVAAGVVDFGIAGAGFVWAMAKLETTSDIQTKYIDVFIRYPFLRLTSITSLYRDEARNNPNIGNSCAILD
jgi:hypothetical protein